VSRRPARLSSPGEEREHASQAVTEELTVPLDATAPPCWSRAPCCWGIRGKSMRPRATTAMLSAFNLRRMV